MSNNRRIPPHVGRPCAGGGCWAGTKAIVTLNFVSSIVQNRDKRLSLVRVRSRGACNRASPLQLSRFLFLPCVEVKLDKNFVTAFVDLFIKSVKSAWFGLLQPGCRSTRVYAAPSQASESCTRAWLGEGRCSSHMLFAMETIPK